MANDGRTTNGGQWTKVFTTSGNCVGEDCAPQQPTAEPVRVYRHALPTLGPIQQTEQVYVCPGCGRKIRREVCWSPDDAEANRSGTRPCDVAANARSKEIHAWISGEVDDNRFTDIQYPAVLLEDSGDVLPTQEGTIQDGTYIDRQGNPELMAEFAQQYLSAYRTTMPTGRPPRTVVEVMPALQMLLIAAELAMKADLIRSGKKAGNSHALSDIHRKLDDGHRGTVDDMFARCAPANRLKAAGATPPSVLDVLAVYDRSYGGRSKVYLDTRYYAEPGAVSAQVEYPYPVFLPHVVEAMLEGFRHFDGAASSPWNKVVDGLTPVEGVRI